MGNGIISVGGGAGGAGGRRILKSARKLPFKFRTERVTVLLSAIILSLCLHESELSNGIISVGRLEECVADGP